ncbi:[NiFe]-hydrogenase assembly chaperone HybE [Tropicimonas sp.]|uniref:[NiFe]-hydrogenase assembly chaperone HybE n=1 Tax=Tropicimonas sp. TaxID=2067044 RepID=UPI003A8A146F
MSGFEGSYMGAQDKISPLAIMECKICWTPYDPAEGDDSRQIDAGTPFLALPDDWSCPNCAAPKEQFLVQADPGSDWACENAWMVERTHLLEKDFTEIWHSRMRDLPMVNKLLRIQAVGFRLHEGRPLGVLISPWFMNLVMLPAPHEDWSGLITGSKEVVDFPSGRYEFIRNTREMVGGYKACSLFSPMEQFTSQARAAEVARAVMVALFQREHRAGTDRAADIRAAREAELAQSEPQDSGEDSVPALHGMPSRRQVLTAGIAETGGDP